ncbi:MAG: methyl-accepting chemotaxis protein [Planctomyces sp.]|jgi:methyl-accepting chemotaxis protein
MKQLTGRLTDYLGAMLSNRRRRSDGVDSQPDSLTPSVQSGRTHSISTCPQLARRAAPVEVAATLPVLDVLTSQLRETAEDMQQSVLAISSGFSGMAARARETVDAAHSGLQSETGHSTEETISEIRGVLQSLLTAVQDSSQLSSRLATRIGDLEQVLDGVTRNLVRVEAIAEEARIVGLNGRLEAARAGVHGAAFNVVANETKNLATNASETSHSVRKLVKQLDLSLRSVSEELNERIALDAEVAQQSQRTVSQLLDQLSDMHESMTSSLQRTEHISEALSGEICRSVVALQFQDRVNQRLDHVCEALSALRENLTPFRDVVSPVQAERRADDWRSWIQSRSTMKSERDLVASPGAAESSSDFGTVELF